MRRGRIVVALALVAVLMPGIATAAPDLAEPVRTQIAQDSSQDGANISASKKKKILKLTKYTGTKAQANAMIDQIMKIFIPRIKEEYPELDREQTVRVKKVIRSVYLENLDGLQRRLVPIYAQNFTEAEIDEMIAFFQTPVGRKYAERLPTITRQTAKVGREWAKTLQPELRRRIGNALK